VTPAVNSTAVIAGNTLVVNWNDGTTAEFAGIWLRDNAPDDRDPHSGQRLSDVADLPLNPRIHAATPTAGRVQVVWADESRVSIFSLDQLYAHAQNIVPPHLAPRLWLEGAHIDPLHDFKHQSLAVLQSDPSERLEWLTRLVQDGIAWMSGVPAAGGVLLQAMTLVGRVAETNYGLIFDVHAVPQPENLAYSDRGLGLHTDNPYREPVPGFQALHVLVAAPQGGDSLFADGFALADTLRRADPDSFSILTRTAVPFYYRSTTADLYAERPLIELSCTGKVSAVNYNSRSIAPLRLPAAECRAFYAAYRRLAIILREPQFQARVSLGVGDLVVFDNRRILHGRTAFTSTRHPRHLQGCYLTRDSVYSEAALLRRNRQGPL
jgi:gamma-butyrobetaine dioxygenase